MILRGDRVSSILITCRNKSAAEGHYVPALRLAGWTGEVHLATPGSPLPPLADFQGLLMTGGDDIHPSRWDDQEALHPKAEPDELRDALEIPGAQAFWDAGRPILGICRGEQLLNVARGGSLIQDLPSRLDQEAGLHQRGTSSTPELAHAVQVAPGSRVAGLVGALAVEVNSRHHQAVLRVGEGLTAVAWHQARPDQDPVIEAIEATEAGRWVVGVQWHPENLVRLEGPAGQAALAIFQGFLAALERR